MPSFSQQSNEKLEQCHPYLRKLMRSLIFYINFSVITGARNKEDQDEAFGKGTSKKKWPDGNHNALIALPENEREEYKDKLPFYSNAIDIAPYPVNWEEKEKIRFYYLAGFIMKGFRDLQMKGDIPFAVKLRWGGDWDGDFDLTDQTFYDLGHFELIMPKELWSLS